MYSTITFNKSHQKIFQSIIFFYEYARLSAKIIENVSASSFFVLQDGKIFVRAFFLKTSFVERMNIHSIFKTNCADAPRLYRIFSVPALAFYDNLLFIFRQCNIKDNCFVVFVHIVHILWLQILKVCLQRRFRNCLRTARKIRRYHVSFYSSIQRKRRMQICLNFFYSFSVFICVPIQPLAFFSRGKF